MACNNLLSFPEVSDEGSHAHLWSFPLDRLTYSATQQMMTVLFDKHKVCHQCLAIVNRTVTYTA